MMAKFTDNNFGDDEPGPDTDPIPDIDNDEENNIDDGLTPTDQTNYQEPGIGDSFAGEDPSVWEAEGNPEKPEAQTDQATSPIEIDSQSATVPDGGGTFGRNDDPDAKENIADEEAGDDEDDTAKIEDVSVDIEEEVKEYIEEDDYFDEVSFDTHLKAIEALKEKIDAVFEPEPEPELESLQQSLDVDENIKFPSIEDLLNFLVDEIEKEYEFGLEFPDFDDDTIDDDLEFGDLADEDQYEMPGLAEIVGSLDINDYIGDTPLNSLLAEFQYVDAEENNELL